MSLERIVPLSISPIEDTKGCRIPLLRPALRCTPRKVQRNITPKMRLYSVKEQPPIIGLCDLFKDGRL